MTIHTIMQGRKTQRLLSEATLSAVPPYFQNSFFHFALIPALHFPITQGVRHSLLEVLVSFFKKSQCLLFSLQLRSGFQKESAGYFAACRNLCFSKIPD
ncbi:MAG: hypothetical protein ISR78_04045 [Spirochaetia bacterium]|nr:hypothetical protein [Spirochaetia bacterium]